MCLHMGGAFDKIIINYVWGGNDEIITCFHIVMCVAWDCKCRDTRGFCGGARGGQPHGPGGGTCAKHVG